jgi:hypothetical protein
MGEEARALAAVVAAPRGARRAVFPWGILAEFERLLRLKELGSWL